MSLDLTLTDLFCGAGGLSIGAVRAGATVRVAANHWDVSCTTYANNNPAADVRCVNVSQSEPRWFPRTDILVAGPECRTHSKAGPKRREPDIFDPDGDPDVERSRVTMWDIPHFAEEHEYSLVLVENVLEITKWKPFESWFGAMRSLGYQHRTVSMNSMTAWPTPQSRDRLYMAFWRRGNPKPDLEFRPPCWCPACDAQVEGVQAFKPPRRKSSPPRTFGKYREQYLYRCPRCRGVAWPIVHPALSAIDLTIPCPRIGDRKRPLAAATRRRIELGLEWFGGSAVVQTAGHTFERNGYARAWSTDDPLPAQTATAQHSLALRGDAMVVPLHHLGTDNVRVRSVAEPWPTQTGRQELALVVPLRRNGKAVPADRVPWATITAGGTHHALVVKNNGDGTDRSMYLRLDDPLGTVTSRDSTSLVALPFTVDYHTRGAPASLTDPLRTQDTHERHALVDPGFDVDDCGLRMLQPPEIGRAMAFPGDYELVGNKSEQVRQYGHAVTPPAPALILGRMIQTLEGAA